MLRKMDIRVLKSLAQYIQKKTWDNKSLGILWIKVLGKMMSLNRNLNQYVHKIRYQGDDLKIDFEWARVVYSDIDTNYKTYNMRSLRHFPNVAGYLGPNMRTVRTQKHWQERRLPHMPYIRQKDRNKIMKEISVVIKYGRPFVEVDINKNALSRRFYSKSAGRKLSPSMINFIAHVGRNEMKNRVNLGMVLSEDPVNYNVNTDFKLKGLETDLELGKYQLENIRWFLKTENSVPASIQYTKATRFGKYYIDPYDPSVLRPIYDTQGVETGDLHSTWSEKPDPTEFKLMGGALLDEMGLGKTVVMIISSVLNPAPDDVGTPDRYVFPQLKRECPAEITSQGSKKFGEPCGIALKEPLQVYCKKHRKKFPDSTLQAPPADTKLTRAYQTTHTVGNQELKFLKSRATLVICPNTVPDHWVNQCNHITNKKLKILKITCQKEYTQLCYRDLINADFVIVSFDFVAKNPILKTPPERPENSMALYTSPGYLPYIHWHRIIVDEIHEIKDKKYQGSRLMDYVLNMKSTYRWCMSGSAFTKAHESYKIVIDYLMDSHDSENVFHYLERSHHKYIIHNFFRRNTYQSTCAEKVTEIPPVIYKEIWLDFSPTERAMYKTRMLTSQKRGDPATDEYLRQLCCHPQLSAETKELLEKCGSMDQIHKSMQQQTKNFIENTKKEIEQLEDRYEYLAEFLDPGQKSIKTEFIVQDECPDYLTMFRVCKGQITRKTKQLANLERALTFYDDSSSQNSQPKNILEKLETTTTTGNEVDADEDMEYLVHLYGTKMGHLIKYFRTTFKENPDDCVIIFSQWDNLLKNIQTTLNQNGIQSLCCKGSVFQKKKAVERFKKKVKGVRILLLSTKYAASGLDLMEANKIILVDPVYGTEKYKEGIEGQAIHRAARLGQERTVEVIRLLMRDTIEEEIHFSGVPKEELKKVKII
jgi:SNF2 family DNA or RNA helicase